MSWFSKMLGSSIGQKLIMGVTGLFLISFLVVHCGINALIFMNDGGQTFNKGAEFMGTNWLIRTMEIVLFAGLLLHIIKGYSLTRQNLNKRPVEYAVSAANKNSKWYSRSMGLLGTLLLIFLIIHLKHFWITSRFTDQITGGHITLYEEMKIIFSELWVVVLYMLSMISLGYHLLHGFQSAFQTLGLNHKRYTPLIKNTGVIFSILFPLLFALMPLVMYLGIIK
ncbi:MAG: succinate dehydrogenase [Bacteroidetes bacterium]|nr:MAG: succinate dehydrogenase [Bacteroidota bacterium]